MSAADSLQHAQFSMIRVVNPLDEDDWVDEPRPAHLERHAPGQYQPTFPGMERLLPGEHTHVNVFFRHDNKTDDAIADVRGSTIFSQQVKGVKPSSVDLQTSHLHPTQNWMNENYLYEAHGSHNAGGRISTRYTRDSRGTRKEKQQVVARGLETGNDPVVEKIPGVGNVVHDGHHRVVRAMLGGRSVRVNRWES